jgi:hypothetical protein
MASKVVKKEEVIIKPKVVNKKLIDLSKLKDFKIKNGFNEDVKDKELEWIPISKAFTEATGLSGIPKGYITLSRGFSNTGKSTSLMEAIVSSQKLGILPVIIDTENNFNWEHAKDMGLQFDEVIDEETGEIVNYDGFFIFINNEHLIENYGKKRDKNRQEAVIEDVADFCHDLLDKQTNGELPHELLFAWDSIGTLDCEQCVTSKNRNNMWNAGALEAAFKSLINHRIPASRKEGKPYTNTMIAVQKIWIDSMAGKGSVKHKGGEAFFYGARLILHFGGIISHGTEKLKATSGGKEYSFAISTKIEVVKNQINGIQLLGKIISTPHGFVSPLELETYKKENKDYLLSKLGTTNGELSIISEVVDSIDGE